MATENVARWIASNRASVDTLWHRGVRQELRGAVTGKLLSVFFVTACSGQQLGGPWGQTVRETLPDHARICSRCAKKP